MEDAAVGHGGPCAGGKAAGEFRGIADQFAIIQDGENGTSARADDGLVGLDFL